MRISTEHGSADYRHRYVHGSGRVSFILGRESLRSRVLDVMGVQRSEEDLVPDPHVEAFRPGVIDQPLAAARAKVALPTPLGPASMALPGNTLPPSLPTR